MEPDEKKNTSCFIRILICQMICVAILMAGILVIRFCFKPTYRQLYAWYQRQVCVDTDIDEVLQ